MSKAQIKKALSSLPSRSIISIMMELYDSYPDVKENLDARFAQDKEESASQLLEKYKKIIQEEYFPSKGEEKCRVSRGAYTPASMAICGSLSTRLLRITIVQPWNMFSRMDCRMSLKIG